MTLQALDPQGVILCVGEALVSLTPPTGAALEDTDTLEVSAAGAEANVAVHLARQGVPVRFAGAVGRDPLGQRLVATLAAEGVDTGYMCFDDTLPTGLYLKNPTGAGTAVHYYRNGSAATRFREVPRRALEGVTHVHVTGITPAISQPSRDLTRSLLTRATRTASFDVNYRQALWAVHEAAPVLRDLAARASVTFVGLDEAQVLWGVGSADELRSLFPQGELVVKNGAHAAFAFAGSQRAVVPALPVTVLEAVGAGDAFAAGYLASRRRGDDMVAALRWGHALAAGALAARGDQGDHPDPQWLAMAHSGRGWPDA